MVGQGRVAGVVVWSARAGSAGESAGGGEAYGFTVYGGRGAAAGAAPGPAPPPGDSTPLDLRITQTEYDYYGFAYTAVQSLASPVPFANSNTAVK